MKEGETGLKKGDKGLRASHFHTKVRDTEVSSQIKDLGKVREGYVRGNVLRPKKRRYRGTKADTGLVTLTDNGSL
jgi:hypothetical protein